MIEESSILGQLVKTARDSIARTIAQFKNPVVLWSGGKDSMVMLHLMREMGIELPVICWSEPWLPKKLEFMNKVIADWNLTVFNYPPTKVELCKGNRRIDILNHFQTGPIENPKYMICARGTEKPEEGKPWLCGIDTFLSRPVGSFNFNWDLMVIGHKSSDEDPTSGPIPLKTDLVFDPRGASMFYPLRNWMDDDIFKYIFQCKVPFDENRYDLTLTDGKIIGTFREDKHANPDYYHTCLACCDKDAPDYVDCPKFKMQINNISKIVPYASPRMDYCTLRTSEEVPA